MTQPPEGVVPASVERPRRSALFLPASNARALEKARGLDCDVVILDLEDAVAPESKLAAREAAVAAVRAGGFGRREVVVRANAPDTDWGAADLAALAAARPDGVVLPKVDGAATLDACAAALDGLPLWAMVETAAAMLRLEEIASHRCVAALVLGTNDLASELRVRPDAQRTPFLPLFSLAVCAARAHGRAILDGVCNELEDDALLATQCAQAASFGFDGKTLIHPRQVGACNAAFSPTPGEVAWAARIEAAFALPENAGLGAIRLDGRMVERMHLAGARRVLAIAAAG